MRRSSRLLLGLALSLTIFGCGADDEEARVAVELWAMPNSRPYMPRPEDVAQLIKHDLEAVGFDVQIVTKEWGTYLDETKSGKHQLCLLGWTTDNGDPDNFLYSLLDKSNANPGNARNVSFYRSDDLHEVLVEAQTMLDVEKRAEAYRRAQEIILEDCPMVPLVYAKIAHAMRNNVIDFHQNPIGNVVLHTVRFEGQEGGALRYARGNESNILDPIATTEGESVKIIDNVYETLVRHDLDVAELRPGLARSWSTSEDGLTWTFELQEGVRFHDGTPMDAAAVVTNFERIQAAIEKKMMDYGTEYEMIDSIRAEGTMKVVFALKSPSAIFLANLSMFPASIVSPTALDTDEAGLKNQPVGTGPFRLEEWKRDEKLVLVRFEDYWDASRRAHLDRVIFTVEKDPTARVQRLRDGYVDFVDNINMNDYAAIDRDSGVRLLTQDGMNFGYLAMNNDIAPFQGNPLLRQAVACAINKERILSRVYDGYGRIATHPMPPTLRLSGEKEGKPISVDPFHHEMENFYAYDPERARRLLQEAVADRP